MSMKLDIITFSHVFTYIISLIEWSVKNLAIMIAGGYVFVMTIFAIGVAATVALERRRELQYRRQRQVFTEAALRLSNQDVKVSSFHSSSDEQRSAPHCLLQSLDAVDVCNDRLYNVLHTTGRAKAECVYSGSLGCSCASTSGRDDNTAWWCMRHHHYDMDQKDGAECERSANCTSCSNSVSATPFTQTLILSSAAETTKTISATAMCRDSSQGHNPNYQNQVQQYSNNHNNNNNNSNRYSVDANSQLLSRSSNAAAVEKQQQQQLRLLHQEGVWTCSLHNHVNSDVDDGAACFDTPFYHGDGGEEEYVDDDDEVREIHYDWILDMSNHVDAESPTATSMAPVMAHADTPSPAVAQFLANLTASCMVRSIKDDRESGDTFAAAMTPTTSGTIEVGGSETADSCGAGKEIYGEGEDEYVERIPQETSSGCLVRTVSGVRALRGSTASSTSKSSSCCALGAAAHKACPQFAAAAAATTVAAEVGSEREAAWMCSKGHSRSDSHGNNDRNHHHDKDLALNLREMHPPVKGSSSSSSPVPPRSSSHQHQHLSKSGDAIAHTTGVMSNLFNWSTTENISEFNNNYINESRPFLIEMTVFAAATAVTADADARITQNN